MSVCLTVVARDTTITGQRAFTEGVFLAADWFGDKWEITVLHPIASLGVLCQRCSQHGLRPIYHPDKACPHAAEWAEALAWDGAGPEPSGRQALTKAEVKNLAPTLKVCGGCKEVSLLKKKTRLCVVCTEKKAVEKTKLAEDKAARKSKRAQANAHREAAAAKRQLNTIGRKRKQRGTTKVKAAAETGAAKRCERSGPGASVRPRRAAQRNAADRLLAEQVASALTSDEDASSESEPESASGSSEPDSDSASTSDS